MLSPYLRPRGRGPLHFRTWACVRLPTHAQCWANSNCFCASGLRHVVIRCTIARTHHRHLWRFYNRLCRQPSTLLALSPQVPLSKLACLNYACLASPCTRELKCPFFASGWRTHSPPPPPQGAPPPSLLQRDDGRGLPTLPINAPIPSHVQEEDGKGITDPSPPCVIHNDGNWELSMCPSGKKRGQDEELGEDDQNGRANDREGLDFEGKQEQKKQDVEKKEVESDEGVLGDE